MRSVTPLLPTGNWFFLFIRKASFQSSSVHVREQTAFHFAVPPPILQPSGAANECDQFWLLRSDRESCGLTDSSFSCTSSHRLGGLVQDPRGRNCTTVGNRCLSCSNVACPTTLAVSLFSIIQLLVFLSSSIITPFFHFSTGSGDSIDSDRPSSDYWKTGSVKFGWSRGDDTGGTSFVGL